MESIMNDTETDISKITPKLENHSNSNMTTAMLNNPKNEIKEVPNNIKIEKKIFENPEKLTETMKQMKMQREAKKYCDVVMKVQETEIYGHSCVLAASSPFLNNQLSKTFGVDNNFERLKCILFPSDNIAVVEIFVEYIYSARLGLGAELVEEVLRVANILGMIDVITYCGKYLAESLNIENWFKFKILAIQHQIDSLLSVTTSFLVDHLTEIMYTETFLEFSKDDVVSTLKDCNPTGSKRIETRILNALLTWICHNYEARRMVYHDMLRLLRPELLNVKSVSAMLDLARFKDTGIAKNELSVQFIDSVSKANQLKIDETLDVDLDDYNSYDGDAAADDDDEYKPNTHRRKRPRKVSALKRMSDHYSCPTRANKQGRPRQKEQLSSKTTRNHATGKYLKAEVSNIENADELQIEGVDEENFSAFRDWSLTTTDMDITVDIDQPDGTAADDVMAYFSNKKNREILKCSHKDCTYETLYQKCLAHHEEWHCGTRQHVCTVCGDAFNELRLLARHSKLHTGRGKKYDCNWCPYTSLRSDKLRDHVKNRHQDVALKLGLYEKGARGKHTNFTLDPDKTVDSVTDEQLDVDISSEVKMETRTDDLVIDLDSDKVKQLALYGIVPKKPRKLDFSSMGRRSRTKKLVGKEEGVPLAPLLDGAPPALKKPRGRPQKLQIGELISCPKCPKEFTSNRMFNRHLKSHGNDQPLLCDVCGYATRYNTQMRVHMKIHSGNVLKCTWEGCNYETPRPNLMKDHINRHEGIKNHVCSICGKAFIARKHMQRHEKTHAELKPISCPVCEFRTHRGDKLTVHLRIHHPEQAAARGYLTEAEMQEKMEKKMTLEANKPYSCSHCSFRAATELRVTDHAKRKHPESVGFTSNQEWVDTLNGYGKRKKLLNKQKKGSAISESSSTHFVSNFEDSQTHAGQLQVQEFEHATQGEPSSPLQSSPLMQNPVTGSDQSSVVPQVIHTGQAVARVQVSASQQLQHSHPPFHTPSTAQVISISQNHLTTHPEAHLPGSTTHVVAHHQPGTDLVPPYIAMIEGVLPLEVQAQLKQPHWPYQ